MLLFMAMKFLSNSTVVTYKIIELLGRGKLRKFDITEHIMFQTGAWLFLCHILYIIASLRRLSLYCVYCAVAYVRRFSSSNVPCHFSGLNYTFQYDWLLPCFWTMVVVHAAAYVTEVKNAGEVLYPIIIDWPAYFYFHKRFFYTERRNSIPIVPPERHRERKKCCGFLFLSALSLVGNNNGKSLRSTNHFLDSNYHYYHHYHSSSLVHESIYIHRKNV